MSVAAFTFRFHGDAFHLAPQTCGFTVVHEASAVFVKDSEQTSSIKPAMEDEHDSKDMVSRGPVQCHIALDLPNFCNILALSLSLSHRDEICFFLYKYPGFFRLLLFQLSHLLEDRFVVLVGRFICNLLLSSTKPAKTSCLSLNSFTSCLKIWKSFWPLSFLACLAICMIEKARDGHCKSQHYQSSLKSNGLNHSKPVAYSDSE